MDQADMTAKTMMTDFGNGPRLIPHGSQVEANFPF
jgi:hypothetical protein